MKDILAGVGIATLVLLFLALLPSTSCNDPKQKDLKLNISNTLNLKEELKLKVEKLDEEEGYTLYKISYDTIHIIVLQVSDNTPVIVKNY